MKKIPNYQFWNKKSIKEFHRQLNKQFGFSENLDYIFLEKKDKVYIISTFLKNIPFENMRLNSMGMYIAKREKSGLRLSIEGSQLIGQKSKKNIHIVSDSTSWLRGEDIETEEKYDSMVIIKYKKDFIGCGIYKEGKILNCINKSRRVK